MSWMLFPMCGVPLYLTYSFHLYFFFTSFPYHFIFLEILKTNFYQPNSCLPFQYKIGGGVGKRKKERAEGIVHMWRLPLKNHKGKNSLATCIPLKSLSPGNQHCIYHSVPKLDISLSPFPMTFLSWLLRCV